MVRIVREEACHDRISPTALVAAQPDPTLLWHLGHPSLQKLRSVFPVESSGSTLGCELGKHHRVSFSSQVNNHRQQLCV